MQSSFSSDAEKIKLATDFTIKNYCDAVAAKDREAVSNAILLRFQERYIDPVTVKGHKHGFTMMAVACLMIETLQSFRDGTDKTPSRGGAKVFETFFSGSKHFPELKTFGEKFYKNVRCGILHQAETTGGWKINRKAKTPLFDSATLTINAELFLKALDKHLRDFCTDLKTTDWADKLWTNVQKKMNAICSNCERPNFKGQRKTP